jgi:hypothetical protein
MTGNYQLPTRVIAPFAPFPSGTAGAGGEHYFTRLKSFLQNKKEKLLTFYLQIPQPAALSP